MEIYLGGGLTRQSCPPPAQNVLIFMQFSGRIGEIIGWRPPLGNPGSATASDTVIQWDQIST